MPHYKTNTERSSNITNNLSYVFNPITGQPLRIGTRTHRQLIKDRLLNVSYMNRKDHIVFDGTDLDNVDLNKIKKKLKPIKNIVYLVRDKNIISQRRKITTIEIMKYTIKCACDVIKHDLPLNELQHMSNEDIDIMLTKKINQCMVGPCDVNMEGDELELFQLGDD